jgi:hypothetical protein
MTVKELMAQLTKANPEQKIIMYMWRGTDGNNGEPSHVEVHEHIVEIHATSFKDEEDEEED